MSHPAWVCGLKLKVLNHVLSNSLSHPAWVCGLKRSRCRMAVKAITVTPCVGVWIETYLRIVDVDTMQSHPAWVCGLKP